MFRPTIEMIEHSEYASPSPLGWCRFCGAEDTIEADAENLECEECGKNGLCGTLYFMISGEVE